MAVYTKTGDKGKTSLYSSDRKKLIRTSKDSLKIQALGSMDELNSFLGITKSFSKDKKINNLLSGVQNDLFTIGSILAGAKLDFSEIKTKELEKQIDEWETKLTVLKNFIVPGGSQASSLLFYARTLVRRAERNMVTLAKKEKINPELLKYLNRLSDYLFVMARFVNRKKGVSERIWMSPKDTNK